MKKVPHRAARTVVWVGSRYEEGEESSLPVRSVVKQMVLLTAGCEENWRSLVIMRKWRRS